MTKIALVTHNFARRSLRQFVLGCAVLLFVFTIVPSFACAEDKSAETEPKTEEKQSAPPSTVEKKDERSFLDKVKDELLQKGQSDSTDPNSSENSLEKMERAVKGMRSAGNKLEEGQSASETQKIQKQVIKDLDDIINQLENPPPNQGGGGGGGGGGGNSGSSSSRNRQGGGASSLRRQRPQGVGSRGNSSRRDQQQAKNSEEAQNSENAKDSSKSLEATKKAAEEAERRRKLEMDIWGHLPAHLREELLNTYGERMLPKYEQLVKQFYEALSTQNDKKSR